MAAAAQQLASQRGILFINALNRQAVSMHAERRIVSETLARYLRGPLFEERLALLAAVIDVERLGEYRRQNPRGEDDVEEEQEIEEQGEDVVAENEEDEDDPEEQEQQQQEQGAGEAGNNERDPHATGEETIQRNDADTNQAEPNALGGNETNTNEVDTNSMGDNDANTNEVGNNVVQDDGAGAQNEEDGGVGEDLNGNSHSEAGDTNSGNSYDAHGPSGSGDSGDGGNGNDGLNDGFDPIDEDAPIGTAPDPSRPSKPLGSPDPSIATNAEVNTDEADGPGDLNPPRLCLDKATNEQPLHQTLTEILALEPVKSSKRKPIAHLQKLIESFFVPQTYLKLADSIRNVARRSGYSTTERDEHGQLTEGNTLAGRSFIYDQHTPPDALRALQDRWYKARQVDHQRNECWGKTRWMILAMECHIYWSRIRAILEHGDPSSPDKLYVERIVEEQSRSQVRGICRVDLLKKAVAPYLGFGANDQLRWKYIMTVGKAVSVFNTEWGLLPLLYPTTLVTIGPALLEVAIPYLLNRHPSLRLLSTILFSAYVQPLLENGCLDRRMLFPFSAITRIEMLEHMIDQNERGLVGLFNFDLPHPATLYRNPNPNIAFQPPNTPPQPIQLLTPSQTFERLCRGSASDLQAARDVDQLFVGSDTDGDESLYASDSGNEDTATIASVNSKFRPEPICQRRHPVPIPLVRRRSAREENSPVSDYGPPLAAKRQRQSQGRNRRV
ncbi:MAG: hypothetical protein Q9216_002006 [Gyalolechia sp. 2 TL-2023]